MNVTQTTLPGVLLLEPTVFTDSRVFFWKATTNGLWPNWIVEEFVQDKLSNSSPVGQAGQGCIWGDLRCSGGFAAKIPNFWPMARGALSGQNKHMLWIPAGFAHGF